MEPLSSAVPRVIAIVLMYGGARNAIECVSSLLRSRHPDYRIVLLDNASRGAAFDKVRAWARGAAPAPQPAATPLGDPSIVQGPIEHIELAPDSRPEISTLPPLTLVETGSNLGYAGGNNVALRWLLESEDWDYAWIVNPDAVAEPEAMSALVARAQEGPDLGMIGARICEYPAPNRVENWGGGKFWPCFGTSQLVGLGRPKSEAPDRDHIERTINFVSGASLFITKPFLQAVGPMEESYFLYYEEVDWAQRRGRFRLGYAHDALVYHKHGASIGSSTSRRGVSALSIYWSYRNRFVFTRKYFAWALPCVYLYTYIDVLKMARAGAWRNALRVLLVMHGLMRRPGPVPA